MKFRSDRTRIAIVGAAYRMPGVGSEGFWEALIAGKDLVSTVDPTRWEKDAYFHPRKSEPGSSYTFAAGSIGDVSGFDAAFFGISPREAEQMDPQQRLLLEMAWESLESARIPPSSLRGARCGVYVGLSSVDYAYRRADDLASLDATTMTGNTGSIAANRISYVFDLRGPSMTVDTACSSSLVALHQACQSIRHGESDSALVGGISLHLHPFGFVGFSKASMLSPHGRCRVFDENGDGYVRSEGGAVVLLKPLAQAIAEGNPILGVILESGTNNDGRKSGLTVPSHSAQAQLLREVYERAGIAPVDIDYLEAHGTGTAVGDPIEARAIGEAIGQARPAGQPLPIGSVKSQVGHLEAASGMAGLIKALHVLRHRRVPANLHLTRPNPHIDFAAWNLAPVTSPLEFAANRRLIVGVSAFGFGGANAHAVLSTFESEPMRQRAEQAPAAPLVLSARSVGALRNSAARMARFLRDRPDVCEYDIAFSALTTRDLHPHRLAASSTGRTALADALERFAATGSAPGVVTGKLRADGSPPAFVFSGNGSQWAGMGVELLEEEPLFRETLEEIDSLLSTRGGRSVIADLRTAREAGGFERTEIAQPALFALQAGLVRLLGVSGVHPAAVCGHSVGEVAAAWASGALSLEAAVRVIHERSARQAETRGSGRMAAVALGDAETAALIQTLGLAGRVRVAAVNAPGSITVAGDEGAVAQLCQALSRRRIACRQLALDYAFHTPAMEVIREGLLGDLEGLDCGPSAVPFYSTASGSHVEGSQLGAEYWWRNVREPVLFQAAIRAMLAAGINTFVEIGPRPVLLSYIEETARSAGVPLLAVPTLSVKETGGERIRTLARQLELSGAGPDRRRLFPVAGHAVDLPHYPWQRERFWHPSTAESLGLLARRRVHPLLGHSLPGEPYHWETHLDATAAPGLRDHKVGGAVVFPAAGFVEMALAAAALWRPGALLAIEDLEIQAALVLEADRSKSVRLRVDPRDGILRISSRDRLADADWHTHVVARLVEDAVTGPTEPLGMPDSAPAVGAQTHYARAKAIGLEYGPAFQSVTGIWLDDGSAVGTLAMPQSMSEDCAAYLLHPAYLDGALQLFMDLALGQRDPAPGEPVPSFLPVRIDRLELVQPHQPIAAARVRPVSSRHQTRRGARADFTLYDAQGAEVAHARGVRFRAAALQRSGSRQAAWIATRAIPVSRRATALALPSPAEAARRCAERLHEPARTAARQRFSGEVEPLLDALCGAFAERALRALSGDAPIDPADWESTGLIAADAMPLARTLLQILTEDGVLQAEGGQWQWRRGPADWHYPEPSEIWNSLIVDYLEYAPVIIRTGTAGARLIERLRTGPSSDAHERRAAADDSFWTQAYTREEAVAVFRAVDHLLAGVAAAQPAECRLRVLHMVGAPPPEELGDAALLQVDSQRCELILGARSRESLEEWQSRYPRAAALRGHVINLDDGNMQDGRALGGAFDVVVLGHGISGAADPGQWLERLQPLLYAGGLLIALEQHPSRAESLQLADAQTVRRGPSAWISVLARAGFVEVDKVLDAPESATGPYLLLARSKEPGEVAIPDLAAAPSRRAWLLVHDAHGYSAELAGMLAPELERAGQTVVQITSGAQFCCESPHRLTLDVGSREHWERSIAELQRAGISPDGWVHLTGLDLATGTAPCAVRLAGIEGRAGVLASWLQAAARHGLQTQTCVIGAQTGLWLLPAEVRAELVSDDPAPDRIRGAALWGLTRVAMQEFSEVPIRWIDLAEPFPCGDAAAVLARELLEPDEEDEILLTTKGRFAVRLASEPEPSPVALATAPARLEFSTPGSFDHLTWRPLPESQDHGELAADEVEIDVRAAGLNFRDVMYAMGLLPEEAIEDGFCGPALGMEVAGVVRRSGPDSGLAPGDEVIAVAPAALAQRVRTRAFAVARKPPDWSFAAAATVPTAFFTVYYALAELARLQPGERVLIHGAAGGVGIAAIQLARHLGAEVFATAGTAEKRELVRLLGADRVFDSRSLKFADEILQATGGAGVDVVLNSLAGEAMRRNIRLLRPFGRMVELGKRDFYENTQLGLRPFRNNIAYFAFDADQLMARRPEAARRVFGELMALFASGSLHPLPFRTFCASNVDAAFRQMQASRHVGKIVISFPDGFGSVPQRSAAPGFALRADAAYLVTGGLSGFGLRTAMWLAERGGRHLVLMSRSGAGDAEAHAAVSELSRSGVAIECVPCDVADPGALEAALARVRTTCPPLRGIVHAAAVIEDALLRDLSREQLHRVLAPKVAGAINLHEATRACNLDFFIVYSSATTLFGNPGQAAYVAANMALEALAAERRALGLPATCIGWGPIADAGYLTRHERVREALVGRIGGRALAADEALRALDAAIAADISNVGFLEIDWSVLGRFLPGGRAPKFSQLARLAAHGPASADSVPDLRRWLQELPRGELLPALTDVLRRQIAHILRISPERIEPGASLAELGMDSLMAVELAAGIEDRLGARLSALSLADAPTIERIAARLAQQLRPETDPPGAVPDDAHVDQVRAVAGQHASEISEAEIAQFSAELSRGSPDAPLTMGAAP